MKQACGRDFLDHREVMQLFANALLTSAVILLDK